MARTYKRDSNGRFSSTGTSRSARPATRMVSRGTNRLTRDNAGRITSVGGQGATARGGRLRTASGKLRATQLVKLKGTGGKLRKPMGGGGPRISRAEPLMTGGTLAARSSLTRAKRKLEQNPTPAQRGAVTRAKKYAAQSYDRNTQPRKFGRPASVMRKRPPEMPLWMQVKGGGGKASQASNNVRPFSARQPKNAIKPLLVKSRRNPLLTESRKKIGKYTRQVMRLQRNYSTAQKDVSNPRNRRTMRTAQKAFEYLRTARNSVSPSPRRGRGGGSTAPRPR